MRPRSLTRLLVWIAPLWLAAAVARADAPVPTGIAAVTTHCGADSVTVGQRFTVTYHAVFADSLKALTPASFAGGTCRVISTKWSEGHEAGRLTRTGTVVFIPVSVDSAYVPPAPVGFVTPHGDTLRAWTDAINLPIRLLATKSKDLKPLKAQWKAPFDWLPWVLIGLGVLVLAAALIFWLRRRRRREVPVAPELRLPPDFVALKELERIAGLGLVERGEFKTFYTLVVDAVRRYIEARFGVQAMDRTTQELTGDLTRHGISIDDLAPLMTEADLVKFAKYVPDPEHANAALERGRNVVVSTTPRVVSDAPPEKEATA